LVVDDVALIDPNLAVYDTSNNPINIKWMDLQVYMLAEIQRLNKDVITLQSQVSSVQSILSKHGLS
jgi:hypothetical protein